ncbi:GntR family transcriptional regulator [Pseudochrobactrum kiredjianiae]|uniref:GntR family transcriptional regulator n=1 Tax=Pseudochrobactrum kiredjianiae TaxID=386305 RepID=A0ABW3V186_9HYPH|nr:GntR family transcriptional regulator [Pseudochrobactrum kiredjianiae]MDM7852780.1 GntR family transcriptional regulator [Pseudochrobactrum kiredjianiae]
MSTHSPKRQVLRSDIISKVDKVYNTLKDDILNVRIAPNYPLKIGWLQEHYSFGTTPIREALSRLEKDYLVVLFPNKGYYTASTSLNEFLEVYSSRNLIKLRLIKESIQFGDEKWEAQIVANHYLFSKEATSLNDDYDSWLRAHDAFTEALLSAHKSPWLFRFHVQLTEHVRRQGRALFKMRPEGVSHEFSFAALRSSSLRSLYTIDIYTEIKNAALNRDIERITCLIEKCTELFTFEYNEIQKSYQHLI